MIVISGLGGVWRRFQLDLDVDRDILDEVTVATTHSPDAKDIKSPPHPLVRIGSRLGLFGIQTISRGNNYFIKHFFVNIKSILK